MKRTKMLARIALLAFAVAGLGSCTSGGGGGLAPLSVVAFNFAPGFGGVHLNSPLEVTFSAPIDATTVNQDSVRIFTTTTTIEFPDPGAPATGDFVVMANVLVFRPQVPQFGDLSDTGLFIGFTYTIQIPASPDVIEPVRTIRGDPNLVNFTEFFTTLNQTILPAPGEIQAEPNLNSLSLFFIDEGIENGIDPVDRTTLPPADRDSPQVIDTDPNEGESGFGTITGILPGLGTAFVRLDPISLEFSEPIGPWRIRPQNITIKNANLGGETFNLFFFFIQDRTISRLQITVFDADSAFDQASVPQGRYILELTQFTDLAGNPLVNTNTKLADGTFQLSFSTVSSPTLPTDLTLTFQDDDQDGHVDVGGLATAANDPNIFPEHMAPFLGGFAIDTVSMPSPSQAVSNANWGNVAFWTGCGMTYDNGFRANDPAFQISSSVRLRGGTSTGATAIMAPIAGRAIGRSDPAGSVDGSTPSAEVGKVDFSLVGSGTATLFTGSMTTGPIVYHYNEFNLLETVGGKPTLTYRADSIYPMVIFVEDVANITGTILCDGTAGGHGFNGMNDGSTTFTPGGLGGNGGPGGGDGGNGGVSDVSTPANTAAFDGQNGQVPVNVLGPLEQLSEAMAGIAGMSTGGGGHFDETQNKDPGGTGGATLTPAYSGGGGGGTASGGTAGGDIDSATTPGVTDHGVGGNQVGSDPSGFEEVGIYASGGAGGGGGGGDDDGGGNGTLNNDTVEVLDDGGGAGGGGGGFFGLSCGGDINLGFVDPGGDPDLTQFAVIRAVGGRGGSSYQFAVNDPPEPADALGGSVDITGPLGQGEAGGGGGGGGICLTSGGNITFDALESYVHGKRGGNAPDIEGDVDGDGVPDNRGVLDEGGAGGGGKWVFSDLDGVDESTELFNNPNVIMVPDPLRDLDLDGTPDLDGDPAAQQDLREMSGVIDIHSTIYGDDPREPLYGTTVLVSEFFDTLSDTTSYDEVRVLSNAPRFPYSVGTPTSRTMQVFFDATNAVGITGLPNLSIEDAMGNLVGDNSIGATEEIGLHFDQTTGLDAGAPQFDSRTLIPAVPPSPTLQKRFVRVRVFFNLGVVAPVDTKNSLLGNPGAGTPGVEFAPAAAGSLPIADDPATTTVVENSLGNQDQAPVGVPAIAEIRVKFTP